jgi:hypothetical protein
MKIKEYRSQFIQELLRLMMQAKQREFFLSDTREVSVKKELIWLWILSWFLGKRK